MIIKLLNKSKGYGFRGVTLYNNIKTNSNYRKLLSLSNKTFKDGGTIKTANARKWKHKFGGILKAQFGLIMPSLVDTRSDTTRLGYHEGYIPWGAGNDAAGEGPLALLQYTVNYNPKTDENSEYYDPYYTPPSTGIAPTPAGFKRAVSDILKNVPLVGTGKAFSVVPTKWSIRSAYAKNTQGLDAAQKAAALDFAEEFGLQTPKFGRGRPSYKGFDGQDVRYNPTTTTPSTQRMYAENKKDNIHLSRGALTRYKGDYAQSTNDARHLSEGRPRTKATRLVLIGHLEGSYADSYYGRLWAKILRNEARRGYETPTIKENKLKVLRAFAEHYGYYFK